MLDAPFLSGVAPDQPVRLVPVPKAPDVLVNAIAPGAILWDVNEPSEEKKQQILADIPMKRIGSDKDIVMLADYLITKNTYMTGRNICVDGGKSLS